MSDVKEKGLVRHVMKSIFKLNLCMSDIKETEIKEK